MHPCDHEGVSSLGPDQRARYARHLLIPEIGLAGQERLAAAAVLVIGAGGLGSPALTYLAAAGVGRIGIVDDDVVELSNLQRQVIHTTADLGKPKVASAADRLTKINPDLIVEQHRHRLDPDSAWELFARYDVVIDGTDNFPTRYLISDVCAALGVPEVWAAVYRFDAAISVFWRGHGPCYRCVHPQPPAPGAVPSCAEAGVLGALPGVVGAMQAVEAVKILTGAGRPMTGLLNCYDALNGSWRAVEVAPNPNCPACGPQRTIRSRADVAAAQFAQGCATGQPTDAEGDRHSPTEVPIEITVAELDQARADGSLLVDVRTPAETALGTIDGSILIPLAELPERLSELPPDRPIITYCAVGARSLVAVEIISTTGRTARSLAGGIAAWDNRPRA